MRKKKKSNLIDSSAYKKSPEKVIKIYVNSHLLLSVAFLYYQETSENLLYSLLYTYCKPIVL